MFQNFTFLGKGGGAGLTHASAGTFWETSAEFMAMQVYPDGGAGDLTRFLRTENLAYSSSRHHYGNWMLVQYLVDKYGGIGVFNEHVNAAAGSGWSFGFVAVRNGVPRYGAIVSGTDAQLSFLTQPGENEVYLVVTGTPGSVHRYAFLDGYTKNYRYPYEFRISGATPSGHEPGHQKPAASGGGHWHSNGGGWVDNRATVAGTVYVGPRAAVFGSSRVSGNVRIEDLPWVNSGATLGGNVVVKNNAIVQGGANLSDSLVLGGDAEMWITCSAGTYLLFNPDRGCDGRGGEADINPPHGTFTDEELAITGG